MDEFAVLWSIYPIKEKEEEAEEWYWIARKRYSFRELKTAIETLVEFAEKNRTGLMDLEWFFRTYLYDFVLEEYREPTI